MKQWEFIKLLEERYGDTLTAISATLTTPSKNELFTNFVDGFFEDEKPHPGHGLWDVNFTFIVPYKDSNLTLVLERTEEFCHEYYPQSWVKTGVKRIRADAYEVIANCCFYFDSMNNVE